MPGEQDPNIKVVDRRRFRTDGAEVEGAEDASRAGEAQDVSGEAARPADEASRTIAGQAARLDEITRAYAALVEDNKAYRQRLERERDRVLEAERVRLAQGLLEAADELERTVAAIPPAAVPAHGPLATLLAGVRLALAVLERRIAELGATRLDLVGTRFDPRLAEAVDLVPVRDASQDEIVVEVVRAGWSIGDRILRPARVRVGRVAEA
jgi:molecular chaperone GrpE